MITAVRVHPTKEFHWAGDTLIRDDGSFYDNSSTYLEEVEVGSDQQIDYWSVYYRHSTHKELEWVADFKKPEEVLKYARFLAEETGIEIENPWRI